MEDDLLATTLGQIMVGEFNQNLADMKNSSSLTFLCVFVNMSRDTSCDLFLFKSQIISKLMVGLKQEIMTSNSI